MELTAQERSTAATLPANGGRWVPTQINRLAASQRSHWVTEYRRMLAAYAQASITTQNIISRDFCNRLREAVADAAVTMSLHAELADLAADLPIPAAAALRRAAAACDTPQKLADLVDAATADLTPILRTLREWGISPDAEYNEINRRANALAAEWKQHNARQNPDADGHWLGNKWIKTGDNDSPSKPQQLRREADPAHYRKQLKKALRRGVEHVTGYLEHQGVMFPAKWVSSTAKTRHRTDRELTAEFAQKRAFVSDQGQVISGAKLLDPAEIDRRRYAKYACRWEGICKLAEDEGNQYSAMITATLPPEYHRMVEIQTGAGQKIRRPNKNWNGADPRQCHDRFQTAWERYRARLAKEGINPHFIRAAQPHKDGTPHYHITVLVTDAAAAQRMVEILQEAILSACPTANEAAFMASGVDLMPLVDANGKPDPSAALRYGMAALAYLLPTGGEGDGRSREEVESISEWSKVWGLRRFTTSHGHSALWDELRKTPDSGHPAQAAAKAGDYAAFVRALRASEAAGAAVKMHTVERVNKYGETYQKPHGWQAGTAIFERENNWLQVWADEIIDSETQPQNPAVTVNYKHQAGDAIAPPNPSPNQPPAPIFEWILAQTAPDPEPFAP